MKVHPRDIDIVSPTRLKPGLGILPHVAAAAEAVAADGGSPRAQIDAARAAAGKRLSYMPHQGARERARRAKRLAAPSA